MTKGRDASVVVGAKWDAIYRARKGLRWWPNTAMIAFLDRHFGDVVFAKRHETNVIELGCGNGGNLWGIADKGFRTYGLDANATSIALADEVCQQHGVLGVQAMQGDILHCPFEAGEFAAAIDVTCFQHLTLPEHDRAISEVKRLLVRGGWFFSYHLGARTSGYDAIFPTTPEVTLLTRDDYVRMLHGGGLTVHSAEWVRESRGGRGELEYLVIDARKER